MNVTFFPGEGYKLDEMVKLAQTAQATLTFDELDSNKRANAQKASLIIPYIDKFVATLNLAPDSKTEIATGIKKVATATFYAEAAKYFIYYLPEKEFDVVINDYLQSLQNYISKEIETKFPGVKPVAANTATAPAAPVAAPAAPPPAPVTPTPAAPAATATPAAPATPAATPAATVAEPSATPAAPAPSVAPETSSEKQELKSSNIEEIRKLATPTTVMKGNLIYDLIQKYPTDGLNSLSVKFKDKKGQIQEGPVYEFVPALAGADLNPGDPVEVNTEDLKKAINVQNVAAPQKITLKSNPQEFAKKVEEINRNFREKFKDQIANGTVSTKSGTDSESSSIIFYAQNGSPQINEVKKYLRDNGFMYVPRAGAQHQQFTVDFTNDELPAVTATTISRINRKSFIQRIKSKMVLAATPAPAAPATPAPEAEKQTFDQFVADLSNNSKIDGVKDVFQSSLEKFGKDLQNWPKSVVSTLWPEAAQSMEKPVPSVAFENVMKEISKFLGTFDKARGDIYKAYETVVNPKGKDKKAFDPENIKAFKSIVESYFNIKIDLAQIAPAQDLGDLTQNQRRDYNKKYAPTTEQKRNIAPELVKPKTPKTKASSDFEIVRLAQAERSEIPAEAFQLKKLPVPEGVVPPQQ
jgi:hypothetical protein